MMKRQNPIRAAIFGTMIFISANAWSADPVADADDLADVPETQGPVVPCPGTR
jgi:hypothetical protein